MSEPTPRWEPIFFDGTGFKGKATVEMCPTGGFVLYTDYEQELAELRKDKARLDWLEVLVKDYRDANGSVASIAPAFKADWQYVVNRHFGKSLRQAIDAAMKGDGK